MAAIIPPGVVCGHSVPTIEFSEPVAELIPLWLGVANAFCIDFIVRKKGANHITKTILDSLPLPRRYSGSAVERAVAARSLMLSATGQEMHEFWLATAPLLGLDTSKDTPIEEIGRRHEVRSEVDVLVARDIFGLTYDEMRYVLDPADVLGADCEFETFGALKRAEEREYRCFRSRDAILQKWQELPSPAETRAA